MISLARGSHRDDGRSDRFPRKEEGTAGDTQDGGFPTSDSFTSAVSCARRGKGVGVGHLGALIGAVAWGEG
jgi:hypothetical protein